MENFKISDPLGYTLVAEQKEVPLELVSEFWHMPEFLTTLMGLIRYTLD